MRRFPLSRLAPLMPHFRPLTSYGFTRRRQDAWPVSDLLSLPAHLRPDHAETLDLILRQSIYILQSRRGYRTNTDAHILAYFASQLHRNSASPVAPPTVLDLGAGVGMVSLLFARANNPAALHLVEIQGPLASRARRNLELNAIANAYVHTHDIAKPMPLLPPCDVVLINPPFYTLQNRGRTKPKMRERLLAHFESSASIYTFLKFAKDALNRTNPDAFIGVIHDPVEKERLQDAVEKVGLGVNHVRHMVHSRGQPCTRLLLQLKLPNEDNSHNQNRQLEATLPPLELHPSADFQNVYSEEIEAFLDTLPSPQLRIGRLKEGGEAQHVESH